MNRRNYARELEKIIQKNGDCRPRLLLHACCGPCSTSVLEYLSEHFEIAVLWYNPNLFPKEEFDRRLETIKEVFKKMNFESSVTMIELPWNHEDYLETISDDMAQEAEGGTRCGRCFELRMRKTAETAGENGFEYFCTTLTVSRHKDAVLINSIGEKIAEETGVKWLPSDFKKRNGENRSQELSEQLGIYRQLYCGCEFSLNARNNH